MAKPATKAARVLAKAVRGKSVLQIAKAAKVSYSYAYKVLLQHGRIKQTNINWSEVKGLFSTDVGKLAKKLGVARAHVTMARQRVERKKKQQRGR